MLELLHEVKEQMNFYDLDMKTKGMTTLQMAHLVMDEADKIRNHHMPSIGKSINLNSRHRAQGQDQNPPPRQHPGLCSDQHQGKRAAVYPQ
jgi:hypothetical protein